MSEEREVRMPSVRMRTTGNEGSENADSNERRARAAAMVVEQTLAEEREEVSRGPEMKRDRNK